MRLHRCVTRVNARSFLSPVSHRETNIERAVKSLYEVMTSLERSRESLESYSDKAAMERIDDLLDSTEAIRIELVEAINKVGDMYDADRAESFDR